MSGVRTQTRARRGWISPPSDQPGLDSQTATAEMTTPLVPHQLCLIHRLDSC